MDRPVSCGSGEFNSLDSYSEMAQSDRSLDVLVMMQQIAVVRGYEFLRTSAVKIITRCCSYLPDKDNSDSTALKLAVNLTAELADDDTRLISWNTNDMLRMFDCLLKHRSSLLVSKALSNMFRSMPESISPAVTAVAVDETPSIMEGTDLCRLDMSLICNMSAKLRPVRDVLMDSRKYWTMLHKWVQGPESQLAASIIKNCCFDTDRHISMVTENFVVPIVYQLAGPEELNDDENAELPLDLQYLSPTKLRHPDPETRTALLESLFLMCATLEGRRKIRSMSIYYILREMYNSEPVRTVKDCCLNLINLLISDDSPDPAHNDLMQVEVPPEMFQEKKLD